MHSLPDKGKESLSVRNQMPWVGDNFTQSILGKASPTEQLCGEERKLMALKADVAMRE